MALTEAADGQELKLVVTFKPTTEREVLENALKQNITTLHNRVNELGVAEPVIQQQGADRIVVQLPGVQDTAKAKDILGRTATLESRLVDLSSTYRESRPGADGTINAPGRIMRDQLAAPARFSGMSLGPMIVTGNPGSAGVRETAMSRLAVSAVKR
jgi:preprotein translocase subunit SecD